MKDFDANTTPIGKILDQNSFFRVPSYQRPFSWDDDQFADLIDDLALAPRDKDYFLGTIVLHRVGEDGNYDIVDGQQRLTSIVILLACLRDRIDSEKHKSAIQSKLIQNENVVDGIPQKDRLEVKDVKPFRDRITTVGGTLLPLDAVTPTEPERRYLKAIEIFGSKILELTQVEREALVQFISQKCVVVFLSTTTFDDAFRLFTVVNDRGKQLRRIDVLKSLNISPDVVAKDTVREKLARDWENLENEVGEGVFESVFHLWRLILLKDKPQGDLVKEFQDRIFGKQLQKGGKFILGIFEFVNLYRSAFLERDVINEDGLERNKFRSLMFCMDTEFKASEWRACVLLFLKKFEGNGIYRFCLAIEKQYLELWAGATRKDERYEVYAGILGRIESAKTVDEAINAIKFDSKKILAMVQNKNLYGAGYCRYVLLRLELLASEHDVEKSVLAKSIEHVLPQKPEIGSEWLKVHDITKIGTYVNSVGNLVLLSKGKNSSASNLEFAEKKTKYLKPRVSDYPRSIQILEEDSWTPGVIEKRNTDAEKIFLNDL